MPSEPPPQGDKSTQVAMPEAAARPHRRREAILAANRSMNGDALYTAGRIADARRLFAEAAELEPNDARLQFKLAICDWPLGNFDSVYQHLQAAVRLDGKMAAAHEWLSQWYLQAGMVDAAEKHSTIATQLAPDQKGILASQAFVHEAAGDLDQAWQITLQLLQAGYAPPRVVTLHARLAPRYDQSLNALAIVMKLLNGQGNSQGTFRADPSLHFAAAELFDRLGQHDLAFAHASEANRLRPLNYDAAANERTIDRLIAFFSAERMTTLPRATYRSELPVFIVGMPRSGTSLLEQILASHPNVYGAGELDFIHRIILGVLQMLSVPPDDFPQCIERLSIDQLDGLSQVYVEPLKSLQKPPAAATTDPISRVIDKMPLNFLHLGFIAQLLPGARVIHCRRDPMDTCLSCFMSNFTTGHEFRGNLTHLGHYHRQYERLMAHWKAVLPLPMLEVEYEQIVGDLEGQTRKMLEFLQLPWDPRCLRFQETRRSVATASVAQVRQPIYGSSVGRWRKYERHLEPLKRAIDSFRR